MIKFKRSDGETFILDDLFGVTEIAGIGELSQDIATENRAFGYGVIPTGEQISERMINIFSEIRDISMNSLGRKIANSFFNPAYEYDVYIKYHDVERWIPSIYQIKALPTKNLFDFQQLNLSFLCPDPFFRSVDEFGKDIADITPMFGFPLISPIGEGFAFGAYTFGNKVEINNDGDAPTALRATIRATGTVGNFKLYKSENEFLLFKHTLYCGDVLTFDTEKGKVLLNGRNANNKLDKDSTFFQIDIGGNVVSYSASTGDNLVNVYINFNLLYGGV